MTNTSLTRGRQCKNKSLYILYSMKSCVNFRAILEELEWEASDVFPDSARKLANKCWQCGYGRYDRNQQFWSLFNVFVTSMYTEFMNKDHLWSACAMCRVWCTRNFNTYSAFAGYNGILHVLMVFWSIEIRVVPG